MPSQQMGNARVSCNMFLLTKPLADTTEHAGSETYIQTGLTGKEAVITLVQTQKLGKADQEVQITGIAQVGMG